MKKKCLYSLLTILSTIMLIGCNSSEPSEEASEPTSVAQGNALESAFLSDDHFELREESITIEYGTPLSDDISEYVIAKDYAGITCEYEETNSFHNPLDNPGTGHKALSALPNPVVEIKLTTWNTESRRALPNEL